MTREELRAHLTKVKELRAQGRLPIPTPEEQTAALVEGWDDLMGRLAEGPTGHHNVKRQEEK